MLDCGGSDKGINNGDGIGDVQPGGVQRGSSANGQDAVAEFGFQYVFKPVPQQPAL